MEEQQQQQQLQQHFQWMFSCYRPLQQADMNFSLEKQSSSSSSSSLHISRFLIIISLEGLINYSSYSHSLASELSVNAKTSHLLIQSEVNVHSVHFFCHWTIRIESDFTWLAHDRLLVTRRWFTCNEWIQSVEFFIGVNCCLNWNFNVLRIHWTSSFSFSCFAAGHHRSWPH